jgi:hypothetical protein
MSVVRDFDKLKRFNVEQLYDQYQANAKQDKQTDAKTAEAEVVKEGTETDIGSNGKETAQEAERTTEV